LSTAPALRLQKAQPSATTTSTSSQDPSKAASAESTVATSAAADPPQSKIYSYEDILAHTSSPSDHPNRILIDVREPAELQATGYIPTAINIPITSSPDAFFLPETEFEDRFGIPRPGPDAEVVFYCKAGVRSRAAARMAAQAEPRFGGKVGEFPGSWLEWEGRGGRVERRWWDEEESFDGLYVPRQAFRYGIGGLHPLNRRDWRWKSCFRIMGQKDSKFEVTIELVK
jgi:rhodanese-related sulfurtransferase